MGRQRQFSTVMLAIAQFVPAGVLFIAGVCVLWWSEELMVWLIYLIGEDRALGTENVIRNDDGSRFLTNPGAMILWTIPFWVLGILQITASLTLASYALRRRSTRSL